MKKHISRHLLAIVGVVLLIGLVASCKSDEPEPRFKVLESVQYTAATQDSVGNTLYDKYFKGMTFVPPDAGGKELSDQYWPDIRSLVTAEMQNKDPSYGLMVIVKADNYRLRIRTYWNPRPQYSWAYLVYK